MKTLITQGGKTFLTPAVSEDSSVCWNVDLDHFSHKDIEVSASVKVRDCYKLATIEFYGSNHEQKLQKIDTFINELHKFRQAYINACAYKKESELWLKR